MKNWATNIRLGVKSDYGWGWDMYVDCVVDAFGVSQGDYTISKN